MQNVVFPKDFLFGAAICDYQHFGYSNCDLPQNPAARHRDLFGSDFRLLKKLGLNVFRTSLEWARIEPEEGKIDKDSVDFYHEYLSSLKSLDVKIIVTLHHFTNPKWIHMYGGWLSDVTVDRFRRYVKFVCQELDQYIDYYIIINEPVVYAKKAYLTGEGGLPPYHNDIIEVSKCITNLNEAIRDGYDIIHLCNGSAKVGVAESMNPRRLSRFWNSIRFMLSKIDKARAIDNQIDMWDGKFDFCGLNYYCKISGGRAIAYPEGLRMFCQKYFEKYRKPILITENGMPSRDDQQKSAYLMTHLEKISESISIDHVNILGYCWWSFLHGYEWGLGFEPFFALVDVDIGGSYERRLTETASLYSEIIKDRGFCPDKYKNVYYSKVSSIQFENWI